LQTRWSCGWEGAGISIFEKKGEGGKIPKSPIFEAIIRKGSVEKH
jgi:hypothetical protein